MTHYLQTSPSKAEKAFLALAMLTVCLGFIPFALPFGSGFAFQYILSSFIAATILVVSLLIYKSSVRRTAWKINAFSCAIINLSFFFYIAYFLFLRLSQFHLGASTLYEATVRAQVSSDAGFIQRIFSANFPTGLALGYVYAGAIILINEKDRRLSAQAFIVRPSLIASWLFSLFYLVSSGSLAPIIAIASIIVCVSAGPIASSLLTAMRSFRVKRKYLLLLLCSALLCFTILPYLLQLFSAQKTGQYFSELVSDYVSQVFSYQAELFSFVLSSGSSGSGGLVSLLPILPSAFASDPLLNYKQFIEPVVRKGVWFGLTGRHLIEFGVTLQPFALCISMLLYVITVLSFSRKLVPGSWVWHIFSYILFMASISIWMSEPWTSVFVAIAMICSYSIAIRYSSVNFNHWALEASRQS